MCNGAPNFRLLSLFRMRRNFYFWFTLFLFSSAISSHAQKRLIVKVNPEFRSVFENKNSELSRIVSNLNLPQPQKKFPSHSPLKNEKNKKTKFLYQSTTKAKVINCKNGLTLHVELKQKNGLLLRIKKFATNFCANLKSGRFVNRVTRWLDYLLSIWLFTAINICPIPYTIC